MEVKVKSNPPIFTDTTPKKRGRPRKVPLPKSKKSKKEEPSLPATSSTTQAVMIKPNLSIQLPELEEWDPTSLPEGFFVTLEGKRRTGKSTFVKWLLQWYQHAFSLVWVMSQTAASGYWQKFVGKDFVFDSYQPVAINKLIERNDAIIAEHGEDSPITKETASALIILDDCISQEIWMSEEFIKMAVEGRHHKISIIFVTQDPKTICPKVRDNSDVAIVFNQKTFRNKESIWHDFMNDVDKNTALALLAEHAVEHFALVCVQTNLNGDVQKNFFKSTGDKTKLQDEDYMLGGPTQKAIIKEERQRSKEAKRAKVLAEKADKRPNKDKVDDDLKAASFTVEKILGL